MRKTWGWIWVGLLVLVPALLISAVAWKAARASGSPPLQLDSRLPVGEGRRPSPIEWRAEVLPQLPAAPTGYNPFATDFSWNDLRSLDLSASGEYLRQYASFSTRTTWPDGLPADFNPAQILEEGKNPGLGVRSLHEQGVTGKGVRVAILDQTLLREHQEYAGQISRYSEVGKVAANAELSGAMMASLVAGRSIGVAPEATVDYYAVQLRKDWTTGERTLLYAAEVIQQILDENQRSEPRDRVRVIAMEAGAVPGIDGYAEIMRAYERAWSEGVLVLNTDFQQRSEYGLIGLGRAPGSNPEAPAQYRPAALWESAYFRGALPSAKWIGMPQDSRTVAFPTGPDDYAFERMGGGGWPVAYATGLYALACQVRPDISPLEFLRLAYETSHRVPFERDGQVYTFVPVVNPAGLIEAVSRLPAN